MSRKRGIVISYTFTILNTLIGLFMSAFVIKSVGQENYGVYQAITAFASYLVLFELGTGNILNRNISLLKKDGTEQKEIDRSISTIWSIVLTLSAVIFAFALVFFFSMDRIYLHSMTPAQIAFGKPLFALVIIKLIFAYFTQTLNGALIGFEHYSAPKVIALAHLLLRTVLVVAFLSIYRNIQIMVLLEAILEIAMFIATVVYGKVRLKIKLSVRNFDKTIFKAAMPLALALLFQSVINMANNSVDKFVISVTMPPENVAIYSVAMYIFTTFSSLTSLPITMYMPEIAKNMRAGVREKALTQVLVQPCRLVVIIGGAIVGGFIAIGRPFITFMYGSDYLEAWLIAVVIMVPMLISMTNGVVINILDILNKRLIRSAILLATAIMNIILTVWWVQTYGMLGAAVATAIATSIGLVITNTYYSKALKLKILFLFYQSYKGILPCLILAVLGGWGVTLLVTNALLKCLLGGCVFLLVFAGAFSLFGANQAEKDMLKNIIGKIHKSV